jgi:bacillithiol system protein YtxJ
MKIVVPVHDAKDLDAAFEESKSRPVILFKHSPTCPVSGAAWAEFLSFVRSPRLSPGPAPALRVIDVLAGRTVARLVAERTGVRHESPQALVLRGGKVARHASHGSLVFEWFDAAIEDDSEGGAQ